MTDYYDLPHAHRQVLTNVAVRYDARPGMLPRRHTASHPLADLFAFSMGDPERLRTAFRNRSAHGSACHRYRGRGLKAERRLNNLHWDVWRPIMKQALSDLLRGDCVHEVADDAPWYPCSRSFADHMLEAVPPLWFLGGFATGEAHSQTARGTPIYLCFRSVGDQKFCRYATIHQAAMPMTFAV